MSVVISLTDYTKSRAGKRLGGKPRLPGSLRGRARMDSEMIGKIRDWVNAMERLQPGFTGWFRLEFENRFPEFKEM